MLAARYYRGRRAALWVSTAFYLKRLPDASARNVAVIVVREEMWQAKSQMRRDTEGNAEGNIFKIIFLIEFQF